MAPGPGVGVFDKLSDCFFFFFEIVECLLFGTLGSPVVNNTPVIVLPFPGCCLNWISSSCCFDFHSGTTRLVAEEKVRFAFF